LESLDPNFAREVAPGDVVVAGENFGIGSSREQAAEALKFLGISAVVARSFGGIFFRNALNLGLLAVTCADSSRIRPGDLILVDAAGGHVENITTGERHQCNRLPSQLLSMVTDGGLIPHLEKRAATTHREGTSQ
jgi:3-isopropylmalate/(R)-2-methylmalate dehydratase small subunit